MVLSCLRCMASEEDSGTVMKRSCQPSFHVNRREDKITQAGGSNSGAVLVRQGELEEGDAAPLHVSAPCPCLRGIAAVPICSPGGPAAVCRGEGRSGKLWWVGSARRLLTAARSCLLLRGDLWSEMLHVGLEA